MSIISSNHEDNYGGITTLMYALASDIALLLDFMVLWQDDNAIDVPQAVLDNYFYDISAILETTNFESPSGLGPDGKSNNNSLQSRLNKDRSDIRAQLDLVGDQGLILFIVDRNGLKKLIGTPEAPVRQNEDYRTGMKVMDTNGYTFYFSGSSPKKVPLVNIT